MVERLHALCILRQQIRVKSERSMPEDRRPVVPAEFGFPDPERIPEGRASLRQAMEFITQHKLDPEHNSAEKIAMDYKLDPTQVQHVLSYFQTLQMHIPQAILKKNPKLLKSLDSSLTRQPSLARMEDVTKLSQGTDTVVNSADDPQQKK